MKEKLHTTNYSNAFIEVAEDCKAIVGTAPPDKTIKTIASMQYELIHNAPYKFSSDEIIFNIYAKKSGVKTSDREKAKKEFFSKGQACLRCSPLAKTYGWGIHFDQNSKVAIYGRETKEYKELMKSQSTQRLKAMRNSKQ